MTRDSHPPCVIFRMSDRIENLVLRLDNLLQRPLVFLLQILQRNSAQKKHLTTAALTRHPRQSHLPPRFGAGVTNLIEPLRVFLFPPHYCGLGAGSILFRAIVNKKQCDMRVFFYVAGHPSLNKRCTRLPGCIRLRNDLYCVEWGVKLYSLTNSLPSWCDCQGRNVSESGTAQDRYEESRLKRPSLWLHFNDIKVSLMAYRSPSCRHPSNIPRKK